MTHARRARELGIAPGALSAGPLNAITDVPGVTVGQVTLIAGTDVRTGVTVVVPHDGNLHADRVPAGLAIGNGHGKFAGATQIEELGEIETPIVLTNTLAVGAAIDGLVQWTLEQPGNHEVRSVNAVVGETNDGLLNDIRQFAVRPEHVRHALALASGGCVAEGSVGAGTGTQAFGWKGGIGTSSRLTPTHAGPYTVGVLVQTNFGGDLLIAGAPVGRLLAADGVAAPGSGEGGDGSVIFVIATDAPLSDRNLTRLARRAFMGLARTGSTMANGSGDYALAFSTASGVRRSRAPGRTPRPTSAELGNEAMSPLFTAVADACEEAIYNALFSAITVSGHRGTLPALPQERVLQVLRRHRTVV